MGVFRARASTPRGADRYDRTACLAPALATPRAAPPGQPWHELMPESPAALAFSVCCAIMYIMPSTISSNISVLDLYPFPIARKCQLLKCSLPQALPLPHPKESAWVRAKCLIFLTSPYPYPSLPQIRYKKEKENLKSYASIR